MTTGAKQTTATFIQRSIIWVSSLLLSFALAASANAQNDAGGTTPPGLTPGTPFGSYPLSGFDNVNLFNGNLNFHLPLLKVGGRGGAQTPIMLKIEERWRAVPITSCVPCGPVVYATYNWWTGYQVGYGPGVMEARTSTFGTQEDPQGNELPLTTLLRLTFTTSDGTEFELRDVASDGAPKPVEGGYVPPGVDRFFNRGAIFKTSDGTSATFISCLPAGTLVPLSDGGFNGYPYPSGYLLLRDGTRYWIDNGLVQWVEDRNGNRITFFYESHDFAGHPDGRVTKIIDSLNRQILIAYDVNEGGQYGICDKITYQGFGATPKTIRISKDGLATALRSDFPRTRSYNYLFPDIPGSDQTRFTTTVVTAVWLPDGTSSYKFYYNDYGELARVVLPSGGAIEYDWGAGINNAQTGGVINGVTIFRRVLERRVYSSSATGTPYESRSTYSIPETWVEGPGPSLNLGYVDVTQYGSGSTSLMASRHYFYGSLLSEATDPYSPWRTGKEYKTESLDSNGAVALQRNELTFWQPSPSWWTGTDVTAPENNPKVTDSITTWLQTSQVAKQHYTYDAYNNRTVIEEYDYGITNPPTFPVRRTEIDYVTTNESLNNVDYTGTGIGADVNQRPYLRSLPKEQRIYAVDTMGAKTQYAKTHFYYDQTSVQNLAGIVGHDAIYDSTYKKRGNLTTTEVWLNTGGLITTSRQYDIAGHAWQVTDARGKVSTVGFASSANTYAFATSATTPIPDSSGLHGSNTAFVTQYDYDLSSGLLKSITNSNNQTTTAGYNDPFDRLTSVVPPDGGGQITYSYGDAPGNLYVQTSQAQDNTITLTSTVRFDGLGRRTQVEQSEGSGSIFVDTQYDPLGRVLQVSNPYRTGDTKRWTVTGYDLLGRVHTVTLPGGALLIRDYLGNAVTGTDPATKARKTLTDALGRVSQVIEDPGNAPHLNYQTAYVYDVLDNLRQVTQGTGSTQQKRYYLYDSIGRLIRARNPEQEINTQITPSMTDPITANSQWSMAFTYDENGNPLTRTDPRNVTCSLTYDNLNRVMQRSYPNNINQTPTVDFTYDGVGTTAQNALGQLTLVSATSASGFSSSYAYDNFDAMGRVLHTTQTTDGHPYAMGYQYDLAGHLTGQQYPSGRMVAASFDGAGRLKDLSSGATHYASMFSYTAHGGIKDLKLGNNLWQHVEFDSYRLQPTEVDLGSTQGASDKLKLNYDYGALSSNNGDILGQTITIPSGPTLAQSYTYDGVNRLKVAKEMQGATTVWQQTFTYDPFGNRAVDLAGTTSGYVGPNPQISTDSNRIVPRLGESYDYDKAGNLSHDKDGHLFEYDADNMQVKYDGNAAQYFYDGSQRRVKSIVGGQTTIYVYDAMGKLLAEYGTASSSGSGTSYLTTDVAGTPRLITGSNPTIIKARHDYLPYGEELQAGVGGRTAAQGYVTDAVRQKYTGKERDVETGLDYFAARYYASSMGRFMSADSVAGQVGNPQTFNRYAYVTNNPIGLVDPTGHEEEGPDVNDDERRKKKNTDPPQMTLVFDADVAAQVEAGIGSYASHGIGPVFQESININGFDIIDPTAASLSSYISPWEAITADHTPHGPEALIWEGEKIYIEVGLFLTGLGEVGAVEEVGAAVVEEVGTAAESGVASEIEETATTLLSRGELTPTHTVSNSARLRNLMGDVAENGIQEPIKYVEESGSKYVVDGHHRLFSAYRLGIRDVPAQEVTLPFKGYKTSEDLVEVGLGRFLKPLKWMK